ncbi:hypothetical protein WJX82_001043 [Trebouxia sp. C0006]
MGTVHCRMLDFAKNNTDTRLKQSQSLAATLAYLLRSLRASPQLPRSGSQTVLAPEDLTDGMHSSRTQTPISQGWQFVDKYTGGDPDHIGIVEENEAARPNAQAGDLTQTPAGLLKTSWQHLQHSTRKMMHLCQSQ